MTNKEAIEIAEMLETWDFGEPADDIREAIRHLAKIVRRVDSLKLIMAMKKNVMLYDCEGNKWEIESYKALAEVIRGYLDNGEV